MSLDEVVEEVADNPWAPKALPQTRFLPNLAHKSFVKGTIAREMPWKNSTAPHYFQHRHSADERSQPAVRLVPNTEVLANKSKVAGGRILHLQSKCASFDHQISMLEGHKDKHSRVDTQESRLYQDVPNNSRILRKPLGSMSVPQSRA